MITFIDREQEQAFLQTLTAEASAHFVMVYGRRRVGKTTLLTHWSAQICKENTNFVSAEIAHLLYTIHALDGLSPDLAPVSHGRHKTTHQPSLLTSVARPC